MKSARKITASLIVALVFAIWSTAGWSQDQRTRQPGPPGELSAKKQSEARVRQIGAEEKLVRDVYARLMRYQSAARDELAAREGISSQPDDYLTFELRDIRSGSIEKISDRSLSEIATPRNGPVITIMPGHLNNGDGPAHAYYEAQWVNTTAEEKAADSTVGEMLRKGSAEVANANRYTSYEVTVHLQGQKRTYRAVVLYQFVNPGDELSQTEPEKSGRPTAVKILDNITSEMNAVLNDESPRVQAPWNTYVKSNLYLEVVRTIKETTEARKPLIPPDATIGYLPGDDVTPDLRDSHAAKRQGTAVAEVTSVSYIERLVAPSGIDWGAMVETTWTVDIDVRYDCPTDSWFAVVSKADSGYDIFFRLLPGVSEATVAAAQQSNHCKMISDLTALGNVTNCQWYMVSAVEAHERVHVTEWRNSLNPEFTTMKSRIESLHEPASLSPSPSQAIAAIKARPQYQQWVNDAFTTARATFQAIADPNPQTDAAEHAVVDPRITAIRAKATNNSWPACPP